MLSTFVFFVLKTSNKQIFYFVICISSIIHILYFCFFVNYVMFVILGLLYFSYTIDLEVFPEFPSPFVYRFVTGCCYRMWALRSPFVYRFLLPHVGSAQSVCLPLTALGFRRLRAESPALGNIRRFDPNS